MRWAPGPPRLQVLELAVRDRSGDLNVRSHQPDVSGYGRRPLGGPVRRRLARTQGT
jgi:hypothetical protein